MSQPFSRSEFPPQGWIFFQPQTGWHSPMPMAWSFDRTVQEIIKHRLANGAITARHNLRTDPAGVGDELEAYTRARLPGVYPPLPGPSSPKSNPQQPLPPVVVGPIEALKRTAQGVAPILEWLDGNAPAVAPELSAKRAHTCAGDGPDSKCPRNVPPDWSKWFTVKASEAIKVRIEKRQELKLSTPYDDKLGLCSACLCPLQTKVHEPLDIILKHLKPEVSADLDNRCWIIHQDA